MINVVQLKPIERRSNWQSEVQFLSVSQFHLDVLHTTTMLMEGHLKLAIETGGVSCPHRRLSVGMPQFQEWRS
jgi:hypothetical protein